MTEREFPPAYYPGEKEPHQKKVSRRNFLKFSFLAGVGLGVGGYWLLKKKQIPLLIREAISTSQQKKEKELTTENKPMLERVPFFSQFQPEMPTDLRAMGCGPVSLAMELAYREKIPQEPTAVIAVADRARCLGLWSPTGGTNLEKMAQLGETYGVETEVRSLTNLAQLVELMGESNNPLMVGFRVDADLTRIGHLLLVLAIDQENHLIYTHDCATRPWEKGKKRAYDFTIFDKAWVSQGREVVVFGKDIQAQEINLESCPKPVKAEVLTGQDLIETLGWQDKLVYIIYGRPTKNGEPSWGSLQASRTAEQSWQLMRQKQEAIGQIIGKKTADFALNVLNPVYRSTNGVIKDVYIQKALELAPENQGLVALNFDSFSDAQETIQRLEKSFPPELLAYLGVGLDIEHFPSGQVEAQDINHFIAWFAQKHQNWAGKLNLPTLVLVYTFRGPQEEGVGKISNLVDLNQYYLPQRTLVVTIFDGYGSRQAKLDKITTLVNNLPNTKDNPALVGVMEFGSLWGDKYDLASIEETFSTLKGAPVYFFASQ